MKNFLQKYISELVILGVIFLILGLNFWGKWAILLLDYNPSPNYFLLDNLGNNLASWMIDSFSYLFGANFSSKFFFVLILIFAWYLGILFARLFFRNFSHENQKILEIFGGIFFLMNPFAYERMMVQPVIYFGVILLGYSLYSLLSGKNLYKKWIYAGIFAGIAFNLFLHASFMIALIFSLYIAFFVRSKKEVFPIIISGFLIFLINANWMLAPLIGISTSVNGISVFNAANYEAFMTNAISPLNVWLTNIFLYGFWGEKFSNHYVNVSGLSAFWYIAGALMIVLMGLWKYSLWRKKWKNNIDTKNSESQKYEKNNSWKIITEKKEFLQNDSFFSNFSARKIVIFLWLLALFSLIFGIGIASPILKNLTLWMAEHIPLWQGYREPQKWIGVLMIVEGVFAILGLGFLLQKFSHDRVVKYSVFTTVIIIFLTWSPGSLFSYGGQLKLSNYPIEYFSAREELLKNNFSGKIVAFPWHSYIGCSWMGRPTIANPIKWVFAPLDIISADNIEVQSILYTNSSNPLSKKIENFLKNQSFTPLWEEKITGFLYMKNCAQAQSYDFLDSVPECQKIIDNSQLSFYQCQR